MAVILNIRFSTATLKLKNRDIEVEGHADSHYFLILFWSVQFPVSL